MIKKWTNKPKSFAGNSTRIQLQQELINLLDESLQRHRFPVLNRLLALRMLQAHWVGKLYEKTADANSRAEDIEECLNRIEGHFDELVDIYDRYDANLHFTPAQLARTTMTVVITFHMILQGQRNWQPPADEQRQSEQRKRNLRQRMENLYNRALRISLAKFYEGGESYTMGHKYYKDINDMFYLFDDFNDRHIHLQRALQMMSMEMQSLLFNICQKINS